MSIKVSRHLPEKAVSVLDQLQTTGLHGRTRSEVLERIVCRWMIEHQEELVRIGVKFTHSALKAGTR